MQASTPSEQSLQEDNGSESEFAPHTQQLEGEKQLATIVSAIMNDIAIIPRGAVHLRPNGEYWENPMFKGFNEQEAENILNYCLLRKPTTKWSTNLIQRSDYNKSVDVFDTLDTVMPENNSFSLVTDKYNGYVFLKSLHWPGMIFFHQLKSQKHGFAYFGNGCKNLDLLFMI